jgi:hypothetical protein
MLFEQVGQLPLQDGLTQVNSHHKWLNFTCLRIAIAVNDELLRSLIDEACRHEKGSTERRKALNRLLGALPLLPGLYRSSHQDYPEAYNRTLEWLCKNIDQYQGRSTSIEQSFVAWINGYLKWRVRDLYAPDDKYNALRVHLASSDDESCPDPLENFPDPKFNLNLLEIKIAQLQEAEQRKQGKAIRTYIEHDPEGKLTQCYPRKYPQCNCQVLACRLLLTEPPETIADLARDYGINNQTLYSHWKLKCLPLLQEIARRFGSQP